MTFLTKKVFKLIYTELGDVNKIAVNLTKKVAKPFKHLPALKLKTWDKSFSWSISLIHPSSVHKEGFVIYSFQS